MKPLRALTCSFPTRCLVSLVLITTALLAPRAAAQGLVFEPDEAYAAYPKLERHRAFLPERVDLSHRFPTPGDQGNQGSCVGWAVGYAARSYYAVIREGQSRNNISAIPSPAYIYGAIKSAGDCDTGSLITRALALLSSEGALSMARYPYSDRQCPAPNRVASPQFRIANWRALTAGVVDDAKGALAKGHPVIIGARMTKDFVRMRGDVVWRGEGERIPGGHAMTLVGYDERRQAFRVINSWGTKWGDGGFGWIGYEAYRAFVNQAYVMDVAAGPAPAPFTPAPPAPPKRISSLEPGVSITGDLLPVAGGDAEAPSAQACQARCLDQAKCAAWRSTWTAHASPTPSRHSVAALDAGMLVHGEFVPRPDRDSPSPSPQACQARCIDEARCVAWRWYNETETMFARHCGLFSAVSKRVPNMPATSGDIRLAPSPPTPGPAPAPTVTLDPPLASYQCASLDVAQSATGAVVRGFVGSETDLGKLFESAKRVGVRVEVAVRPWPQCETLLTFKEAFAQPGAPELRLRGDKRNYMKGEPLIIEVKTPPVPSYLYLVYVQASGGVVYLVQPRGPAPTPQPQARTIVLGDGNAGGPKFTVDGPYGDEIIIAIASQSPLFDQGRPSLETEREFLTEFRKALLVRPAADAEKRKISGAWIALTTKEK